MNKNALKLWKFKKSWIYRWKSGVKKTIMVKVCGRRVYLAILEACDQLTAEHLYMCLYPSGDCGSSGDGKERNDLSVDYCPGRCGRSGLYR